MGPARYALPAALAGVASGILAADVGITAPSLAAAFVGLCLLGGAALLGGRGWVLVALVALGGVAIGSWRQGGIDAAQDPSSSVASLVDGSEHTMVGTVPDDPRPRADRLQLVLADLVVESAGDRPLTDRLLVWLPRGHRRARG